MSRIPKRFYDTPANIDACAGDAKRAHGFLEHRSETIADFCRRMAREHEGLVEQMIEDVTDAAWHWLVERSPGTGTLTFKGWMTFDAKHVAASVILPDLGKSQAFSAMRAFDEWREGVWPTMRQAAAAHRVDVDHLVSLNEIISPMDSRTVRFERGIAKTPMATRPRYISDNQWARIEQAIAEVEADADDFALDVIQQILYPPPHKATIAEIGGWHGLEPPAARKRWERIRKRLRTGALAEAGHYFNGDTEGVTPSDTYLRKETPSPRRGDPTSAKEHNLTLNLHDHVVLYAFEDPADGDVGVEVTNLKSLRTTEVLEDVQTPAHLGSVSRGLAATYEVEGRVFDTADTISAVIPLEIADDEAVVRPILDVLASTAREAMGTTIDEWLMAGVADG